MSLALRSCRKLCALILPYAAITAARAGVGDSYVATWAENRRGVLSLTHDDNRQDHWLVAGPALTARGLKATFSPLPGFWTASSPSRAAYQSLAAQGHELGSHTMYHQRCMIVPAASDPQNVYFHSLDELRNDCATAIAVLNAIQPNRRTITFTYPGGVNTVETRTVVRQYFLSARLSSVGINVNPPVPPDYMQIAPCYVGDSSAGNWYDYTFAYSRLTAYLNAALSGGGWVVEEYHDIVPPGYASLNVSAYYQHLDDLAAHVQAGDLWVAPVGDVMRYIIERRGASISANRQDLNHIVVGLDDRLPDDLYNIPLTVMTRIRTGVESGILNVTRDGAPVAFQIVTTADSPWVAFPAQPDGGVTVIDWPGADPELALVTPPACSADSAVAINVVMNQHAPTEEVTGGWFSLAYDPAVLADPVVSAGDAPFTNIVSVDTSAPGQIDFQVGGPESHPPNAGYTGEGPVVLARVTLTAVDSICGVSGAVAFRSEARVSTHLTCRSDGQAVDLTPSTLTDLGPLRRDSVGPALLGGPADLDLACGSTLPPAVTDASAFAVQEACSLPLAVASASDASIGGSGCPGDPITVRRTYVVQDACGNQATWEQNFRFAANAPPAFLEQPTGGIVVNGASFQFDVVAEASCGGLLSYQWQRLVGGSWSDIPGATNALYTISSASFDAAGSYRAQATDTCGASNFSSAATLEVQSVDTLRAAGIRARDARGGGRSLR